MGGKDFRLSCDYLINITRLSDVKRPEHILEDVFKITTPQAEKGI